MAFLFHLINCRIEAKEPSNSETPIGKDNRSLRKGLLSLNKTPGKGEALQDRKVLENNHSTPANITEKTGPNQQAKTKRGA